MEHQPQKRHKSLQPLSREHHQGLLLSWKIRMGLDKSIDPKRIRIYAQWFYKTYLVAHFKAEEQYVFSVLEKENKLVQQAISEHERLMLLFITEEGDDVNVVSQIEKELDNHIRFEERVLFPEIQKKATEEQLLQIEKHHQMKIFEENLADEFWK
ncbi:MAG: hemerythrin domain-containing protein [Flavobacteriales bacterium]|nr:hemerythrin domain-containing protein [Flavobacteriales bacterium]